MDRVRPGQRPSESPILRLKSKNRNPKIGNPMCPKIHLSGETSVTNPHPLGSKNTTHILRNVLGGKRGAR